MCMTDEYGKMLYVLFDKLVIKGSFYIPPVVQVTENLAVFLKRHPAPREKMS